MFMSYTNKHTYIHTFLYRLIYCIRISKHIYMYKFSSMHVAVVHVHSALVSLFHLCATNLGVCSPTDRSEYCYCYYLLPFNEHFVSASFCTSTSVHQAPLPRAPLLSAPERRAFRCCINELRTSESIATCTFQGP